MADHADELDRLRAELDDADCEILIMRHYEHLSNQEIAQARQRLDWYRNILNKGD